MITDDKSKETRRSKLHGLTDEHFASLKEDIASYDTHFVNKMYELALTSNYVTTEDIDLLLLNARIKDVGFDNFDVSAIPKDEMLDRVDMLANVVFQHIGSIKHLIYDRNTLTDQCRDILYRDTLHDFFKQTVCKGKK